MATPLEELDRFLTHDFGNAPDGWYDDSIGHAEDLVAALNPQEWARLYELAGERPTHWLKQAVEASGDRTEARPLLILGLRADDVETAEAAALWLHRDATYQPSEDERHLLRDVARRAAPALRQEIEQVAER